LTLTWGNEKREEIYTARDVCFLLQELGRGRNPFGRGKKKDPDPRLKSPAEGAYRTSEKRAFSGIFRNQVADRASPRLRGRDHWVRKMNELSSQGQRRQARIKPGDCLRNRSQVAIEGKMSLSQVENRGIHQDQPETNLSG